MKNEILERLISAFRRLPAVGQKTATRYAYRVLEMDIGLASEFADAILDAKTNIHLCPICGDYTDQEVCLSCQEGSKKIICVVKEPRDIQPFRKMGSFDGVFHVLHGTIDFQKGIGAEDIRISQLMLRLDGVEEIIIATNADISGEMTASLIAKMVKPRGIKVTRLAQGLPMGSEIEYADEGTLSRAFADRKTL